MSARRDLDSLPLPPESVLYAPPTVGSAQQEPVVGEAEPPHKRARHGGHRGEVDERAASSADSPALRTKFVEDLVRNVARDADPEKILDTKLRRKELQLGKRPARQRELDDEGNLSMAQRDADMTEPERGPGGAGAGPATRAVDHTRRRMSARERRQRHLFHVPRDGHVFSQYLPLHELWQQYIDDVCGPGVSVSALEQRLLKADFHGALFRVSRSRAPSFVGVTGIVVQETEKTFKLVTPDNKLRIVPKVSCEFTFRVGSSEDRTATLFGQHLCHRPHERASRKFKGKSTVAL